MVLPSLLDVYIVVALIIPGFAAFAIARYIAVFEKKLPEFETVIWSLLMSLAIYAFFVIATGIADFDSLRDRILEPLVAATLILFTLLLGSAIGFTGHFIVNKGVRPPWGNPWDIFFDRVLERGGRDLVVFTRDGSEFRGWVGPSGKDDNRRELILRSPRWILRDSKRKVVSEISYGEEVLFTQDDIRRVLMLGPRNPEGISSRT